MVVNITDYDCFFLMDVPDLEITGLTDALNVVINYDSEVLLQENYTPTEGKVTLSDIPALLSSYMRVRNLHDNYTTYFVTARLFTVNLTSGDANLTVNFYVLPSSMVMNMKPADCNVFLSHYKMVETDIDRKEYLTFVKMKADTQIELGVAYVSGGRDVYTRVNRNFDQTLKRLVCIPTSPEEIASKAGVNVKSIIYYDVYLKDDTGYRDRVRFTMGNHHNRNEIQFVYVNPFAMPEGFTATGLAENSPKLEGEKVVLQKCSRRIDARLEDEIKVNTGLLTAERHAALKDMAVAPSVVVYTEGVAMDVMIEDVDMVREWPSNKAQSADISYLPANRNNRRFKRTSAIKAGVFDKTFDISFD